MTTGWVFLIGAGIFEIGFTTSLRLTAEGKAWAWSLFAVFAFISFSLLAQAIKTIPLGMAYAIWTGIGAAGTLLVSALAFKDPITPLQYVLVIALIGIVAALKFTSPH